jgi:hypothetical protein
MNAAASWLPRSVALRGTGRVTIYIHRGDGKEKSGAKVVNIWRFTNVRGGGGFFSFNVHRHKPTNVRCDLVSWFVFFSLPSFFSSCLPYRGTLYE